jgi:hypothetical protein
MDCVPSDRYGAAGPDNAVLPLYTHGGTSHAFGAKQHAIGTLVGSNAMKAEGLRKQQEVTAVSVQAEGDALLMVWMHFLFTSKPIELLLMTSAQVLGAFSP